MVLGVAANDPTSIAVANTAADQCAMSASPPRCSALDPVRFTATRWPTTGSTLWSDGMRPAATGDRAGIALRLPALEATPVSTPVPSDAAATNLADDSEHHAAPAAGDRTPTATPTTAPQTPESGELVQAPSNITGICDRSIQPKIDAALRGTEEIAEVIDAVEPRLWNMSTVLPILQDTTIVAAGPSVQGQPDAVRYRWESSATRAMGQEAP